jgi:hypothetical protein
VEIVTTEGNNVRIHGYAAGDRVAVVDGALTGYIGKVVKVWDGCHNSCKDKCGLVRVALTHRGLQPVPDGGLPGWAYYEAPNERTFRIPGHYPYRLKESHDQSTDCGRLRDNGFDH